METTDRRLRTMITSDCSHQRTSLPAWGAQTLALPQLLPVTSRSSCRESHIQEFASAVSARGANRTRFFWQRQIAVLE